MQKNDGIITLLKNAVLWLVLICMPPLLFAQSGETTDQLVQTCSACHGEQGISNNDLWPNLAGQQAEYLANQMIAYRDKTRDAATMWPFVKELSNTQISDIANYYSSLPAPQPSITDVNTAGMNVRAYCISCHGLSGNTIVSEWPNLAGQKKGYLAQQLRAYKTGKRDHPLMNVIASELTEQQIIDVAEYYSQSRAGREVISRPEE